MVQFEDGTAISQTPISDVEAAAEKATRLVEWKTGDVLASDNT